MIKNVFSIQQSTHTTPHFISPDALPLVGVTSPGCTLCWGYIYMDSHNGITVDIL